MDMEQRDYDSRTALHVAAAEGREMTAAILYIHHKWVVDLLIGWLGLASLLNSLTVG